MTRISYIFFGFLLICIQTYGQQNKSIINELNAYKPNQGTIVVYQDDVVDKLLGSSVVTLPGGQSSTTNIEQGSGSAVGSSKPFRARGYRLQIYSGNDQRRSKEVAYARRDQIKSTYPNMEVTISYSSPVWRVRAGNFRTRYEAEQALRDVKARFAFGREVHVVDDIVTVYPN